MAENGWQLDTRATGLVTYMAFELVSADPCPIEVVPGELSSVFFLTCEHAGRAVPQCLGDLGVAPLEMDRHIAYDVGAEAVARKISAALCAPLCIQPYSRLVVDCNRPPDAFDIVPETSDGTLIPGNLGLSEQERQLRIGKIHKPYHREVAARLEDAVKRQTPVIVLSVHSFTRFMRSTGQLREVDLGVTFQRDDRFSKAMLANIATEYPAIDVRLNEPYPVEDGRDFTIPEHVEPRRLPYTLLEICNDLIADEAGQERWAELIVCAARAAAADLGISRRDCSRQ